MTKEKVFSAIKPSGTVHLGNYIGAVKNWAPLQKDYDCVYAVADMHAITVPQNPADLKRRTYEITALLLATGIDAEKNIVFNQSKVSAHAEFAWILNCVARMGWLKRMTQFKEKAGKNQENVSVGLFDYPVLMASDIILYDAKYVPVGEDQKQHVELARDIAIKFNNDFHTERLVVPEPLIIKTGARIMSLRDATRKMGKSNQGSEYEIIYLTDTLDEMAQKIKKAKTDPMPLPETMDGFEGRPEALNLLTIYSSLLNIANEAALSDVKGKQFSEFKKMLVDVMADKLAPITAKMREYLADTAYLDSVLDKGAERAAAIAGKTLKDVYGLVGFV